MSSIELCAAKTLAGTDVSFAYAVKAGPWLFLTGHEAFDFDTGLVDDIENKAGYQELQSTRQMREGTFIVRRFKKLLTEFGIDFSRTVRLDQYYSTPAAVYPYHLARTAELGAYIPPSTSIVMDRCFAAGSSICTSLIASLDKTSEVRRLFPPSVPVPEGSGFSPVVVCGDFVFVAGQMATGPDNKLPPGLGPEPWRGTGIRQQTEYLIRDKIEPALKSAGVDLSRSLKAQVYLSHVSDIPTFNEVWLKYMGAHDCALTVVPATSMGLKDGCIEINLIALSKDATSKKEVLRPAIPDAATFGPCTAAGHLVFPSALVALNAEGTVSDAGRLAAFDAVSHAARTQADVMYSYLDAVAEAAGTKDMAIVRAQYFMRNVKEFGGIASAWTRKYARPHPFVCAQIPHAVISDDCRFVGDFWLYRDA